MQHTFHRTRDNSQINECDAFDENGSLRPGVTMRTKVTAMDSGFTIDRKQLDADTRKQAAIDKYNADISNRWKMDSFNKKPKANQEEPDPDEEDEEEKSKRVKAMSKIPGRDNRDAAYKSYDSRVANAWKSP